MRVAVVPAKDFETAKQRLARALPGEARSALAGAMLEDVLAALGGAGLDRILVVTPDAGAAALAEALGATVLREGEGEGEGHTAAVARGLAAGRELGASLLLTVPGDVPCLTTDEVRAVLAACGRPPAAVFVPALVPKPARPDARADAVERPARRWPWGRLLQRVFGFDVLVCDHCGGPRRILGAVTESHAVRRVLAALGLAAEPPPGRPPGRPLSAA
jgi:hypothetical protein